MAGFKEGALQLKKKDSLAPADIGHMKVLINSDSKLYTVDETGTSALIQGGGSGGSIYWNDIIGKPIASTSTTGILTSADWNTFNNKMDGHFTSGDAGSIPVYKTSGFENSSSYIVGANKEKLVITDKTQPVTDDYHSPGIGVEIGYQSNTSATPYGFFYTSDTKNGVNLWSGTWGNPISWTKRTMTTSAGNTIFYGGVSATTISAGNLEGRLNISTGVVDYTPPTATYNADGTITITSANVNLYDNSTYQGPIKTYPISATTLTLIDGTEQFIVVDYNSGSPYYRIENNKVNINS